MLCCLSYEHLLHFDNISLPNLVLHTQETLDFITKDIKYCEKALGQIERNIWLVSAIIIVIALLLKLYFFNEQGLLKIVQPSRPVHCVAKSRTININIE